MRFLYNSKTYVVCKISISASYIPFIQCIKTFGRSMLFYFFLLHYTSYTAIALYFWQHLLKEFHYFSAENCFQSYSYLSINKLRIKKNSPPLQAPLPTSVNHFKLHIWATNSAFSNNDPPDQLSRWNVEKALFLLLRRNFHSVLKQFSFSLSHL